MDTSDKTVEVFKLNDEFFSEPTPEEGELDKETVSTPQECAESAVRELENSKARLYGTPGKRVFTNTVNVNVIDQDYQMIDAHVEDPMRKRIEAFEYIDLSKLLVNHRTLKEDEGQRLEIINKNGMSFLSPVAEKDKVAINSYQKWEQAFRIYSNVLLSRFPEKGTELLQYNHTIHTASTTYMWEQVYAYDREFRYHISRHPYRAWNVILQQAWTMILKDRLKYDHSPFFKGNGNGNNPKKEICKRFNRGKCNFGLACQYEHRCAVPECKKFGHGAHICRLRRTENKPGNASHREAGGNKSVTSSK